MKKIAWNIGKAVFAIVVFLYLQVAVTVVVTTGLTLANLNAAPQQLMSDVFGFLNEISLISGVMAVAALWLVWWIQGSSLLEQTRLHRVRPVHVVLSALLGVGVCVLVIIAMGLIPWPEAWMNAYIESAEEIAGEWSVVGVLATVIVAPVAEELVFRGVAYTSLKAVMPRFVAAVLVSTVFGLLHGTAIWFCYTFVLSLVMIFVYEKTKSLWGPIAMHMAFNLLGQLPLMDENPSFVSIVLVAGGGVALTAIAGILLCATTEETA